jgi:alpha-glucosidase
MKREIFSTLTIAILIMGGCSSQKKVEIISPDRTIKLEIVSAAKKSQNTLAGFSLSKESRVVLLSSEINLTINEHEADSDFRITGTLNETIENSWINPFGEKSDVPDNYNQTTIFLERSGLKVNLICRAYNEGVAIAYEFPKVPGIDSIIIADEKFIFRFLEDYKTWSAARAQAMYTHVPISKIEKGCERPLVVEYDTSLSIALGEAKLIDYARMKFDPDSSGGISIRSRLDGEVRKSLPFQSPWRYVMIGENAGDLLEKNYFVLNLNDACAIKDVSWIKPGKVLREVTLTSKGAMAAIDFTSSHNMQYVEFDAGWYGPENKDESDAKAVNLDPARSKGPFDIHEVISYANSKNIGILLYVNRKALERQIDTLLPIYKAWGIKGIKFGFVQVGNQDVTRWLHESIIKVASYQMVADVHDEYRTTGFSRTYPNFLTMEGIRGDEESPSNAHTLTTMFTRMIAGQGDNTICYYNERVDKKMGSHASQLAKAVCIFSPLQFVYWYDKASPSLRKVDGLWGTTNYIGDEPELEFFDNVPTVWDETRVLHARIGEYGVIARRKGDQWFIGGINGENPRTLNINFNFLNRDVKYSAKIYSDDPLVDTRTHVKIDKIYIDRMTDYSVKLEANNGFTMHIVPQRDNFEY